MVVVVFFQYFASGILPEKKEFIFRKRLRLSIVTYSNVQSTEKYIQSLRCSTSSLRCHIMIS